MARRIQDASLFFPYFLTLGVGPRPSCTRLGMCAVWDINPSAPGTH